jgi:ParB-like chromosome segregation protein Spo0J
MKRDNNSRSIRRRLLSTSSPIESSKFGKPIPTVVYRPISQLKPDPKNPRLHSPRQIRQIVRSISAFGFNVPILVDTNLNIIAGHGRVLASQQLGLSEVPTTCLDHLTPTQIRAFMIADNRLTESSTWDERILAEQLNELSVFDLDFSLEATGFEMGEIDVRIEALSQVSDSLPLTNACEGRD